MKRVLPAFLSISVLLFLCGAESICAQNLPGISIQVGRTNTPEDMAITVQIVLLLTLLTVAPALLILLTSFTRIEIGRAHV